jgi:DNA-binding transcriptional ArsR family regulator
VFPATLDSDLYKSLAALNHETRGPLLVHIHERSGETTSSLAKALQRPVSTVSRHLNILTDHGITAVSRQGVSRIYQTTPATDRSIARFGSSIIDRFTEAFIDTWEQF